MLNLIVWLQKHTFEVHVAAFLLMLLPAIPLYFAAASSATGLVWVLLGLVVLGNLIVMLVK